jgi:hypothetical protein
MQACKIAVTQPTHTHSMRASSAFRLTVSGCVSLPDLTAPGPATGRGTPHAGLPAA